MSKEEDLVSKCVKTRGPVGKASLFGLDPLGCVDTARPHLGPMKTDVLFARLIVIR